MTRAPGTTASTSLCSGSKATWSHQSPLWSSDGLLGSQFFCFLSTKDHFSSNWTSRVRGGKSHELVVSVVGMLADHAGQASDGVGIDADQASGRSDTTALVEVLEHGEGLFFGEMAVEQGRALALGEARLAGLAVEQADVVLLAVAGADREIAGVTAAVEGAFGILTAEAREVVHAGGRSERRRSDEVGEDKPNVAPILRCSPVQRSVILRHDLAIVRKAIPPSVGAGSIRRLSAVLIPRVSARE